MQGNPAASGPQLEVRITDLARVGMERHLKTGVSMLDRRQAPDILDLDSELLVDLAPEGPDKALAPLDLPPREFPEVGEQAPRRPLLDEDPAVLFDDRPH